jgi:hypothetical protein
LYLSLLLAILFAITLQPLNNQRSEIRVLEWKALVLVVPNGLGLVTHPYAPIKDMSTGEWQSKEI